MRWLLVVIGVLFIVFALWNAYQLSTSPIAAFYLDEAEVQVLPSGSSLSVLGIAPERGIRLKILPKEPVEVELEGNAIYVDTEKEITVTGAGEVPLRIGDTAITLLFDSEGRFLSLSTSSGVELSSAEVSEEFSKAVLAYTAAPFVSGLAFTLGSLAIGRRMRK